MDFNCLIVMVAYADNCGSHWLKAWENSDKHNSKLAVIHNAPEINATKRILSFKPDYYIKRKNIGLDLGAFQDVVKNRLDLPNWDWLIQFTYDTVPMRRDWLNCYYSKIKPNVGLVAGKPRLGHIRTTGFMISREMANLLEFPADPILDKEHCYALEHRSHNLMEQVLKNGFDIATLNLSGDTSHIIWDYTRDGDLWDLYNRQFIKKKYQKKHRLI